MDKSITSQVERVLNLYHILPREPQKAYSIEELKQKIGHFYNNEIDEKSLKKNILRDLKTIELILVSGDLIEIKASGRRASSFYLSPNAYVQQFSSELALVLIMAKEYLSHNLPNDIYGKVKGFFEAAEQQLEKDTQIGAWHSKMRFVPEGYGKINRDEQYMLVMQKIYAALLDDHFWLDVLYRKEGSHVQTKYILKPQGIIQHGQQPYLIASKIVGSKSELRTFNLLRFDEVDVIERGQHAAEVAPARRPQLQHQLDRGAAPQQQRARAGAGLRPPGLPGAGPVPPRRRGHGRLPALRAAHGRGHRVVQPE